MTVLLPPSRALSHQLASRVLHQTANRRSCANSWSRVIFNNVGCLSSLLQFNAPTPILGQVVFRSYATRPGRPKAHTGRVAASKRKPAAARSDKAAGTPKKTPAKRITKLAAKKPKRKTSKAKPKPKPKPRRKALTEKQKAAKAKKDAGQKTKDLREKALLDHPKRLPFTAYTVLSSESSGKGINVADHAKAISAQYKTLSPEEMEVWFIVQIECAPK
jgi:hypothetical protein